MYIYMFCQGLFNNNFICTLLTPLSNKEDFTKICSVKTFCIFGILFVWIFVYYIVKIEIFG